MKNLATCTPTEFVAQTAKIKNSVKNWLDVTQVLKIRQKAPAFKVAPENATAEQRAEVIRENALLQREQAMNNLNEIFEEMLVEHPQETLEVLALVCFVEPADVDKHTMSEYLDCVMDMLQNESVLRFFSLLARTQQLTKSI